MFVLTSLFLLDLGWKLKFSFRMCCVFLHCNVISLHTLCSVIYAKALSILIKFHQNV